MLMTTNTWERRIDREKIPHLEAEIEKDQHRWSENVRGDTFDQTLSARIKSNKEAIRACDFFIKNEDLVSLILQVDKQLGKYQHATKYFTQDLGV
jgi:ribosomal protein L1